jgi:cell division protease FtsH
MDGFEGNEGVIVIAATNRPDVLDKALLRPGRFDRQVYVSLPDIRGREQILKVHARKVPLDESVKLGILARGTPGFSGADLANLVNEAALFSARANRRTVTMEEFENARDKIMMGAERRSMVMSEKEKTNTAYHESGHAIIGRLVPEHDPVHKVTIIPRGRALGVTQYLPEEDRYSLNRRQITSQLCSLFGGRIAEELVGGLDGVTTGASNDIERATQMARNMVTKWGLNEKMGPILYGEDESQAPGGGNTHYSEDTSREIDQEVRRILNDAYSKAKKLLEDNRDILEAMKDALMEYETIDADQVDDLMKRIKVRPPHQWDDNDLDGSAGGDAAEKKQAGEEETKQDDSIGGPVEDV